jgi:hypothetical protein
MKRRVLWLAVLFVLAGCHDPKVEKAEADLSAAKARVAALQAKKPDLAAKLKQSEQARWMLAGQADEAALATAELSAADDVLEGKPLSPAFALPGLVAGRDKQKAIEFATAAVQEVLPCAAEGAPDPGDYGRGSSCEPPALEDACAGVVQRTAVSGKLSCETKIAGAAKAPPLVACTLTAEYPPSAELNQVNGTVASRTLVRAAFTLGGHLYVADYPAPGLDTYQPANELELTACKDENGKLECERKCDVTYNRLSRPDCGDGPSDWGGDGEPSGEEADVPAEVRQARENAAAAEARAAEAEREAQQARDEVAYQECHSACRPTEEERKPRASSDTYKLISSPAPGVLAYARLLEAPAAVDADIDALMHQADLAGGVEEAAKLRAKADALAAKMDERKFLMLLEFDAYTQLATGTAPEPGDARDHMLPLTLLAELEDGVLKQPEKDGRRLVYGFSDKRALKAFTLDGKGALADLDLGEACKKIATDKEASAPLKAACKERAP